ncbi:hypothetical protein BH11PLA1_BH11PLA1_01510 [soil metagenome]
MTAVLPTDNDALLVWGNEHAPVFATNAVAIGLTAAQATAFTTANTKLQAAWGLYGKAKNDLKAAADDWKEARTDFRTLAAADVALIKNAASRSAKPSTIYTLAQIPEPTPRSPSVPPSAAENLRASLDTETGTLTVRWSASQPKGVNGVVYTVQRVIGSGSTFTSVGVTGTKSFIDLALPVGTSRVQYRIVAQRGSLVSPASAVLDVRFAAGVGGEITLASVKLAA